MILNRRYRRNVKKSFSFYLCMTLLTFLAVFMYLLFGGIVDGEKEYLTDFKKNAACEDGQFMTFTPLDNEDIEKLENEYDVVIEKQQYFNTDVNNDFRLRVFRKNEKLNGYTVAEGSDISSDSDILISTGLAQARDIKIGSELEIDSRKFTVCGYFERIDYLLMLEELSDSASNTEQFGIAAVSESAFEGFAEDDVASYYSVLYNKDNQTEFRKDLNETYMTATYLKAEVNPRITTAFDTVDRYASMSSVILPVMLMCIVVLMAVVIGRKVKSEQRQIGVLLSMGYTRQALAAHYMVFGLILGIVGSVLGILMAVPSIPSIGDVIFSKKIEPLPIKFSTDYGRLAIVLIAPAAIYGLFAWLQAFRIMRKDPVAMLRGTDNGSRKNRFRMENSKKSVRTKYMIRSIFGNLMRTFIVIFGIAIGGMIFVYSYVCVDSMQKYVDESVDEAGSYEYEYFLSSIQTEPLNDGVEMLCATFEVKDNEDTITLIGIDDMQFLNNETTEGEILDLSGENFYITSRMATEFGLEKGDKFVAVDVASIEEYEIEVAGIVKNNSQNTVYTSRKSASNIVNIPEEAYNAVMSSKELDYSDSEISSKLTMEELKNQIQGLTDEMSRLVYIMIIFGIMFTVITVYLMVNILISENKSSISMLKILGHKDSEINRMTIHIYHWLVPIGIVLGLLVGYAGAASNFKKSVASYHVYIEPYISLSSIIIYAVLVIISYIISLALLSRKVKNVDMALALKNNNE